MILAVGATPAQVDTISSMLVGGAISHSRSTSSRLPITPGALKNNVVLDLRGNIRGGGPGFLAIAAAHSLHQGNDASPNPASIS